MVQEFGVGPQELGFTEPTPTLPPIKLLLIDPIGDRNATTLNSLVNYLYGVKLDDPFRFILIDQADHEAAEVTGGSKTDCVNVYTLKKTIFGRPVVLVDTPGNVDARETRMRDMLHAALRQGSAVRFLTLSMQKLVIDLWC